MTQINSHELVSRYFRLRKESPRLIPFFFEEHPEATELIGTIQEIMNGKNIHKEHSPKPKPLEDPERKSKIYNLMKKNQLHDKAKRYLERHPGLEEYIAKQKSQPQEGAPARNTSKTLADFLDRQIPEYAAQLILKNPDFREEDFETVTGFYAYADLTMFLRQLQHFLLQFSRIGKTET